MIISNHEAQFTDLQADTWSIPPELWLADLLSSTYNQAFLQIKQKFERSSNLTECLLSKYVLPDLASVDQSRNVSEIIESVRVNQAQKPNPQIQFLTIDNSESLASPSQGNKFKPVAVSELLPSFEKTPKSTTNALSSKAIINSQTSHKPKMIFQSLSEIISEKENTAFKRNENNHGPQIFNQGELNGPKQCANIGQQDLKSVAKRL